MEDDNIIPYEIFLDRKKYDLIYSRINSSDENIIPFEKISELREKNKRKAIIDLIVKSAEKIKW